MRDPIIINSSTVERVNIYIFHGWAVTDTLSWTPNADNIIKEERQSLFFLCTQISYSVDVNVISFYCAVVDSIFTTSILVWF